MCEDAPRRPDGPLFDLLFALCPPLSLCVCSFAVVIAQLSNPLKDAICIFYLVLRALDTVEDDMALSDEPKLRELQAFHKHIYDRCVRARLSCLGDDSPTGSQLQALALYE